MRLKAARSNSGGLPAASRRQSCAEAGIPVTAKSAPSDEAANRARSTGRASAVTSMPIQWRPNSPAAWQAVPQPQNGSSTKSPGLLEARMMRRSKSSGFCVG